MHQYLSLLVAIATLILFGSSSLRHLLLQSHALDLGAFDQWVYLLSRDMPPISSFFGVHVLGDHAAFILYPISLLYRIYPHVYWLLLIQAIALAMGAIPLYAIGRQFNLSELESRSIALCYILYPAVFNSNFYADFRPEAIAVPALLWAIWAAFERKTTQVVIAVALVLSCKERLSLTVIALGLWFCLNRRTRSYGLGCVAVGAIWFSFTSIYLIPSLRHGNPAGLEFYGSLGNSVTEICLNILKNPTLAVGRFFLVDRLGYYLLLIFPVILGLHWRTMTALIPAIPALMLNILSDYEPQRDLIHHYSLPIFPFIFVWLVQSLAIYRKQRQRQWLKARWLVVWAAIAFLILGKYSYFWTRYLSHMSNLSSAYNAIGRISDSRSVLTASHISPHLSHRSTISQFPKSLLSPGELDKYDYVLLDLQHPGQSSLDVVQSLKSQLESSRNFGLIYEENDVSLWRSHPS